MAPTTILLILALGSLGLAAVGQAEVRRVNLVALGLFFWLLSEVLR
jgi:hypothetical protein